MALSGCRGDQANGSAKHVAGEVAGSFRIRGGFSPQERIDDAPALVAPGLRKTWVNKGGSCFAVTVLPELDQATRLHGANNPRMAAAVGLVR